MDQGIWRERRKYVGYYWIVFAPLFFIFTTLALRYNSERMAFCLVVDAFLCIVTLMWGICLLTGRINRISNVIFPVLAGLCMVTLYANAISPEPLLKVIGYSVYTAGGAYLLTWRSIRKAA